MKTTMNQFLKVFLLVCVIGFTSCSSNDDDVEQQEDISAITKEFQSKISKMSLPSSMTNSSSSKAKEASTYFTLTKNLGQSFSGFLNVPPGATMSYFSGENMAGKGNSAKNTTTYTWTADGVTITYSITEEDDRYLFEYSAEGGTVTGKIMDGHLLKDNSYAMFTMYDSGTVVSTFKFWINGDVVTSEINLQGINLKMKTNLSDNSGNIKVYSKGTLTEEYNWNSDGTGWYKNYKTNETVTW